tara:strand:- start:2327 stop:4297 length:1971 start_codon:yes stop_codon:yes gene_type:complete
MEQSRTLVPDARTHDIQVIVIPDITVDVWVDPCVNLPNTHVRYCDCNPNCCQEQTWYCPPRGVEIQAKYAILDICDEDLVPCDRNRDPNCPPAEIIEETGCQHAFDCPPGINEDFTLTYDCEINGTAGTQQVRCDKGRLYYGECVTCFEEEEVCDSVDNDCDGNIDENQLNACGGCGQVPEDICDGLDNDCDNSIDEQLIRECTTICNSGLEICANGDWIGCTAQRPTDEECDGEDNDCDNLVDEGLNCQCPPESVGALVPCMEPPLTCGMGFKTCECINEECQVTQMTECFALCHWIPELEDDQPCDQFAGIPTNPELCNNFDEDCDALVDEQLIRECYTGPEGTLSVGVCAPGTQTCNRGQWYGQSPNQGQVVDLCGGEIVPSVEICDGADNDCDGVVDYGEEIPETDILFLVDWSGSMENYINAVRMAMNRFAQDFAAEDKLKWGLVVGPKAATTPSGTQEMLILQSDITEFDQFLTAFANVGQFDNQTGNEQFKDAIMLSLQNISGNFNYSFANATWANRMGSNPDLKFFKINWRTNADRIIVLFSDEFAQSYLVPRVTTDQVLQALESTPNLKFYAFAERRARVWNNYVTSGNGTVFELSRNQQQMYDDLMSILDDICLGSSGQSSNRTNRQGFFPASLGVRYDYKMGICY